MSSMCASRVYAAMAAGPTRAAGLRRAYVLSPARRFSSFPSQASVSAKRSAIHRNGLIFGLSMFWGATLNNNRAFCDGDDAEMPLLSDCATGSDSAPTVELSSTAVYDPQYASDFFPLLDYIESGKEASMIFSEREKSYTYKPSLITRMFNRLAWCSSPPASSRADDNETQLP